MTLIKTLIPHLEKSISVWRKLYLYSRGDLRDIANLSRDKLSRIGLSPDLWIIVEAVRTWIKYGVPFPIVMVLWRLRKNQDKDGGWKRMPGLSLKETGCVYRYIELALLSGEKLDTDKHIAQAIRWLEINQLRNGGFPTYEDDDVGETGTTARIIRILSMGLQEDIEDKQLYNRILMIIDKAKKYIISNAIEEGDYVYWKNFYNKYSIKGTSDEYVAVGATALAIQALTSLKDYRKYKKYIEKAIEWLISVVNSDGGWGEKIINGKPVDKSSVSVTFNVIRAFIYALDKHIISPETQAKVIERVRKSIQWCMKRRLKPNDLYQLSYTARCLVYAVKKSDIIGLNTEDKEEITSKLIELFPIFMKLFNKTYNPSFDIYHTEIAATALLEIAEIFRENKECEEIYKSLFKMTPQPPRFMLEVILRNSENPSEILYLFTPRGLIGLVDIMVKLDIVSALIGAGLGLAVIMDILSDNIPRYILGINNGALILLALASVIILNILWLWIKLVPGGYGYKIVGYLLSFIVALSYTWMTFDINSLSSLTVVMFYTFIIDIVGWIADKAVLIEAVKR